MDAITSIQGIILSTVWELAVISLLLGLRF